MNVDRNCSTVMHLAPGFQADHMRIYHKECISLAEAGYPVELVAHVATGGHLDARIKFHSLGDCGKLTIAWRLFDRVRRCQHAYTFARHSRATLYQYYAPEFIMWGKRLGRVSTRPVVFDCMEDYEGYALQRRGIPDFLRRPLAAFVRRQLRLAAQSCDAVIVADEGTARLLRPYARRVVVLHNFPNLPLFPDPGTMAVEKIYDVIYHGSLPRYHLDAFLAIDAALARRGYFVRWRLIGHIPEREWFTRELTRRGIQGRFSLGGYIPHNQVAWEVSKAKIGIIPLPGLPKFYNNIPQKLFEFMALKMPVVLSDLPPSRPFVGDGACAVMVPPDDYEAYADAIITLLGNIELRQQMGIEGRRRVEQEYNWGRESQKLIDLYKELVSA